MARQVFFDPFGSYTQGFDSGVQRQTGLEDSVRRARAQDYDFNVLQPYRTAAVQRQDQLDTRAQPYKINMLPIGYQNALDNMYGNQFNQRIDLAKYTGLTQPLLDTIHRQYGLGFATANGPEGSQTNVYARGADGQLYPTGAFNDFRNSILNNIRWPQLFQERQAENQNQYRQHYLGVQDNRYDAYMLGQQAALMRAMNGGGAGYPSGAMFTGFGDSGNYDPVTDYNLPQ